MKPQKLFMDGVPGELPEGTYPYGKNGIQNDLNAVSFNEPGFRKMAASTPYTLMGTLETDNKPVLMSTDDTNSAVGYYNPETELYEPIVDDNPAHLVNWPADGSRLGFKMANYITGEAQRNYKGQIVIAFTDKVTFPKYLNCDEPDVTRIDDIRMFPYYSPPRVRLTESIGGSLNPGTYYVAVGYERNDGTSTPYSEVSEGITIRPGELAGTTSSAIAIAISRADTSYDFMRIAIISKTGGKTTALEITDWIPITAASIDVLYTGDNLSSPITVEEILTPPAVYERIGTIGQLNDALYIGDLEREKELLKGLQKYVNMATVQWRSTLLDATSPPAEHTSGQLRGFLHEEVYALYIRFHKTRGGFTKAFHLPGLPLNSAYNTPSPAAITGGGGNVPRFKVEDCIGLFNSSTKTGICGPWVNDTELYPTDDEFNSASLGGQDLRGQSVRHHRMPSLRWCKNNLYPTNDDYGRTKLDILTLELTNLVLPPDYTDLIDGYELLYAKRTPSNQTNYGQGALLHGVVSATQVNVPTGNADIYTSGGNWRSVITHRGKGDYDDDWDLPQLRLNTFRIHPFDVLLNKPAIEPTFISGQYKIKRDKLRTQGYLEDGAQDGDHNMPTVHLVDYTIGLNPTKVTASLSLRKIQNSFYLQIGATLDHFNNVRHETCFAGTLGGVNWPVSYGEMAYRIRGHSYTEPEATADFEESYIVNLLAVKGDIYTSFYSQTLVSAGAYKDLDDLSAFKGGDTFVCDYTFHTYGRHDQIDSEGQGYKGKKVIRRIVCESASNIHSRYELPGNNYSRWYPRSSVAFNQPDQCYPVFFDRSTDPNQFGYSKDLNALNDFISSTIFNPFSEEITSFPYRVHRGGKLSRQTKPRSWRTFLPLDYYECQKNRGKITNLAGMYDRLIIHHENAMFITQDKAKLDSGLLSITLGAGDIFQFEPQEVQQSKLGYAGTIHDLACVKTPIGYIFPDAIQGELYIWDGSKPRNLGIGINTFLREFLRLKENNSFTGNGITIGWDQKYKRIILTVKNNKPAPHIQIKVFEETDAFYNSLEVGDIVNYNGRYIEYKGLNNPSATGFECPEGPVPPDEFEWLPDQVVCEQDTPITDIPQATPAQFVNLSSPSVLLYNDASERMFVGDHDSTIGNFYRIDLVTGLKNYYGTPKTIYSMVNDKEYNRIWGSMATDGLRIFNTNTEELEDDPNVDGSQDFLAYGTDAPLSRKSLWLVGPNIVALDVNSNTFTLFDRSTRLKVATLNIGTDIPGSATWLDGQYRILNVDGNAWVIPISRISEGITIYSGDFMTLIDTIHIPDAAVVPGWGLDMYRQSAYYDVTAGKVYVHDIGSARTYAIATNTRTILAPAFIWYYNTDIITNVKMRFVEDPVNGAMYFCYEAVDTGGTTIMESRIYIYDRINHRLLKVYYDMTVPGELVRIAGTEFMWSAIPGLRSWEGGSWAVDGVIKQFIHGGDDGVDYTGQRITLTLKLHNITKDTYPGDVKPNLPGDPDYREPVLDPDTCPVDTALVCPVVKGLPLGASSLNYEFSLPASVLNNPAFTKLEVIVRDSSDIAVAMTTYLSFDPNYFYNEVSALDPDTYTIDLVYKNSSNTVIHTCATVTTIELLPTITWEPFDPVCEVIPSCAVGTYHEDSNTCQAMDTVAAIPPSSGGGTPANAVHVVNNQWNQGGGRIFAPGYLSDGTGTIAANLTTPHFWVNGNFQWHTPSRNTTDSRMNWAGVWQAGNTSTPLNEWIGFVRKIDTAVAKTVYIAMCADNKFRFALNGTTLVTNADVYNWNFINIYPVTLLPGSNYIEMWALNTGSIGGFAMEIYDQTFASLAAATQQSDLNVIFSTRDIFGQPFNLGETIGYHCADPTYSLDVTDPDAPVCVKITSTTPDTNPTGIKIWQQRRRLLFGTPDGFTEPNTDGGGLGPYFAPGADPDNCPTSIFVAAFDGTYK